MSELPTVKVSECCDILDNLRIPLNAEEREKIKGNIPYCGANGIQGYISEYIFDEDLILLAEDGGNFDEYQTRPIAYRISGKSWVNNHAHVLRAKEGYDFSFVFYSLQHKNLVPFIKGGTRAKLNQAELREITIWDAPLPIQQRIGEIIETIDNQIDATQAFIDKYTAIKQGMMADLFSRGIDPETKALRPTFEEAPELYHETPSGMLPKGWDIAPFEQLSEVIDPNPSHRYPDSVSIDGVPIASTENFEGTDGFNLVKSKLVPDSEFEKQFERCKYQKDDVIFARKGRIGFARQYGDAKKVFSHTVVVMKAKAGVSPDFLLWLARSTQYLEAIDFEMNSNSGVPTLGVDVIKRVRVAVPSVEEQQDIAKCLNQINKKIHTELAFLAKTKAQKSGLMQDLLTGKIPVPA
ncbi:hypothetical protein FCV50_09920 [Vibrio kanaloae]|uniref:Type I restriction modification DNA specificity domain-containing protein n=1 Tax=Vibrio kanaloae TaxID=170673 RepID=A0A4U1ZDZ9_9VIBR|nr:restriction endonuclease subunit S [Vibrio kanaloae]TKF32272.1 hypothetical protein FCV50_09920 [Vibrio kanaloae]